MNGDTPEGVVEIATPVVEQPGPVTRYAEEARGAASVLISFSQRYSAKGLAEIALDSASLVEQCVATMDENIRTVVDLLQQENRQLRAEIENLVQHSAEAVASVLTPCPQSAEDESNIPSWQPPASLFSSHDQVIQALSDSVKNLSEENDQLREQVVHFQLNYVPKSVADSYRTQLDHLERDLLNKKAELEAALVKLEQEVTPAASATTTTLPSLPTAHDNEDSSFRTLAKASARSVNDNSNFDPIWAEAIRELEERAIVAASQVRDRDYVDQMEQDILKMDAKYSGLNDELEHSHKLMEKLEQDHSVLKVQNDALMGQFVSLLQTTQQLATQYQLLTDRASSGRGSQEGGVPLSPALLTKTLDMDKKAMHSLLEVQQFHQVLDASVMMPQSQSLGVTMDELSKLGASRSQHFGSSPGPRQPYNTSSTYRRFTKEDIASSAEKYSIQSIGDLVRRNQKLIGQATEMELENANLRAENVKLELRVGKQQQESTVQSDASPPRSSVKRSRVEGEPQQQRQTALTADAATLTDSASELLFWHEQSSSQSPFVTHATGVDSAPHALASRSSQGAAVTATAEPLYWNLVNLLSESHRSLIAALDEQLAIVSGEHARNASDALLRSTVAYAARTLRAEYEATVAKSAYEEALEDLHVRDALVPQHLEAIRQIAEHALHRSRNDADAQSSETNTHNHVNGGSKHDSKDISLWNSFTQLLQSATAKEQMFTHLIQEAPTRSELSQTLVSIPEVKLREAEANLVEITTQLEQERSRSVVLADNLHREKLRHVETLERMWEAEQKVAEAEDSLKVMRQSSDCMFTRDQYDAVRNELAAAQMNLVQTQLALDALRDSSNQKLAEKSQALSAAQQEIDHLRHNAANLQSQMAHAQSTNAALNQSLFEAHRDVQNAHAEAKLAIHHRLDMQQELGSSQKLVEELKRALLSQECTEALLLSLFPADSSLEAVFARNRQMNMENVQLKEALAARDLQFVGVENQLVGLRAELRASEDNRQQALVELQLLHTSASAEEHKAASEAKRLALEVEGLQYRLASLQREKEQLQQREKVLEERVEVLAADPISMNVRKYGVERTRTIEQQMEEMNQRCVGLQGNVAELEAQRTTMNTTISTMANEIDVGSRRLNALDEQAADLRKTNETQQAKIESLLESETKLNEVVRSLESEISETSSALEAARQELVANVEAIKLAGVAEQRAKANSVKLLDDNLALIQQVNDLTEVVTRIEAEHRNTKAQLASQTAALVAARSARPAVASAQPSTSSRKSAPSFAEASSWRTK